MPENEDRLADVVVVGAGPAGATAALLFAREGYLVDLVDRATFPRPKTCAEYLSPGVLGLLRQLDLEQVLLSPEILRVRGMKIVAPNGNSFSVRYGTQAKPALAATLPRWSLDAALVEAAQTAGAILTTGITVRKAMIDGGIVGGVSGSRLGHQVAFRGKLTIIADGSRSTLARSLGLARRVRWPLRAGLVAHYEGDVGLEDGFGEMHVDHDGYCGIAPLSLGRANVALVTKSDALSASTLSATSYFDRWISTHPTVAHLLRNAARVSTVRGLSPIGARTSRAWVPGALLVGDAAGFFDPFTGEGIYRAVSGAGLAFEVGSRALTAGDVSARILSSYQRQRRAKFSRKETVTQLVQLFVQYPRLMEYALPRLASRREPATILSNVLGDVEEASRWLCPPVMWATLRP